MTAKAHTLTRTVHVSGALSFSDPTRTQKGDNHFVAWSIQTLASLFSPYSNAPEWNNGTFFGFFSCCSKPSSFHQCCYLFLISSVG